MKFKKAFTFAELIIVFGVVGIISAMAIATFKNYDKGIRFLYSNLYYQLDRAYYNGYNFSGLPNPFAETDQDPQTGEVFEVTPAMGAERLCHMLEEYLNGSASCSSGAGGNAPLAQDNGRVFGQIQFTTDHGAFIYISPRLPEPENPNFQPGGHQFFLVFVDINGTARPNSMEYTPADENNPSPPDPDIFAFAALDTGRLCPLGPPEIDPRYMQARIAYVEVVNDELVTKYTTVSVPYYIAKAQAWGYYVGNNNDLIPIDDEPTSFNDYVRTLLPEDNEIYKFMNNAVRIQLPVNFAGLDRQHGCENRFNEQCWVIVDRYLF